MKIVEFLYGQLSTSGSRIFEAIFALEKSRRENFFLPGY
jgi:hypothetical protein